MTLTTIALRDAADRLIAAAAAPRQCDPVRDILGNHNIAAAYAVQHLLTDDSLARGRRIVGHKIGLTSPAVQQPPWGEPTQFPVVFCRTLGAERADGDTRA